MASQEVLGRFGVIADTQYADADDSWDYRQVMRRLYRNSFFILQRAIKKFNEYENVIFNVQIGDFMDGKAKNTREESLTKLLNEVEQFSKCKEWYYPIGNHELYCFKFHELKEMPHFRTHQNGLPYYSFKPIPGFRMIVLNPYGISTIGHPEDHPYNLLGKQIIKEKNPNIGMNDNWTAGLFGVEKRFVPYNGAIEPEQLEWFDKELKDTSLSPDNEKVIIFIHVPIYPPSCAESALLWNYEEALDIIYKYDVVVAVFSGHDHDGGYAVDDRGIHHTVFAAPLECAVDEDAFGMVEIYKDKLELIGFGKVFSKTLPFPQSVLDRSK